MKTSKTLTSAIVAAALVGGIGLAYAQTDASQSTNSGTSGTSGSAGQTTMQNQTSSDTSTSPSSADTSFQTERPAQPDRN